MAPTIFYRAGSSNATRLGVIAGALLLLPSGAAAEVLADTDVAADAAGAEGFEDIVVSARRRSENLQDVPVAITSIGGDAVARFDSIRTANDITSIVPNASASATDGRTRPRWFLRGVGTNDTGANTVSPIGIYNDDVYLNNVYLQGFPLFDIDHVEVLRGPQGTLWGKNTTGGAVSIVSKRPVLSDTEGWFKGGYGSYSSALLQGAINVPLVTDRLAVRISGSHDQRDGYVRNLYDGDKLGAYRDDAIRGQLLFKATETFDLNLNVHARRLRGDKRVSNYFDDLQQSGPYNNGYADPPGRDTVDQADNNAAENLDSFGASLTANWELGDYTLTSITAYEEGQRLLTGGAPIPVPNALNYSTSDSKQWSQEVRLASPQEGRFSWIVGGYYFDEDLKAATTDGVTANIPLTTPGRKPRAWGSTGYDQGTSAIAAFANATFKVTDRFNVTGGLRYSREKKDIHLVNRVATGTVTFSDTTDWWRPSSVSSPITTRYDATDKNKWEELTYDITPQYRISDHASTYFRFAHGFRAGGFAVSGQSTINPIDPEKLDAYEIGLKTAWLDGKLTLNGAAFYYDYSNIQVLVFAQVGGSPDPLAVLQNAGAGWVKGAELELVARPFTGLRIGGTMGWLDTKYTRFQTIVSNQPADASGNEFARAPHISASLNGEYRFAGLGGEFSLGADWNFRTRQYFSAAIQNNPLLEQKAYGLLNARVAWTPAKSDWEFALSASNLTDKDYAVLATGPTAKSVRRVSGDPRVILGTVTHRF